MVSARRVPLRTVAEMDKELGRQRERPAALWLRRRPTISESSVRPLISSWHGLSGPPIPAHAAKGGPDKPCHDKMRGLTEDSLIVGRRLCGDPARRGPLFSARTSKRGSRPAGMADVVGRPTESPALHRFRSAYGVDDACGVCDHAPLGSDGSACPCVRKVDGAHSDVVYRVGSRATFAPA